MKVFYLDRNIFIDYFQYKNFGCLKFEKIFSVIDGLIRRGDGQFPYSPAHVEEIECLRNEGKEISDQWSYQMNVLQELSGGICFLEQDVYPKKGQLLLGSLGQCYRNVRNSKKSSKIDDFLSETYRVDKKCENKSEFYFNVIKKINSQLDDPLEVPSNLASMGDGRIQTFIAAMLERVDIEKSVKFRKEKIPNKKIKKIMKMSPDNVFQDDYVLQLLKENFEVSEWLCNVCSRYSDEFVYYRNQKVLVQCFYFLNCIGYQMESDLEKSNNRLHDTSHALYATYADVLVSNDRNFRKQTKAIFNYLNVEVEVLSQDEFVEIYFR